MILVAFALLIPPLPPNPPGMLPDVHETKQEPLAGGFSLEHETYSSSRPIMHVASSWEKLRLVWTSPDTKVKLTIEDDGNTAGLIAELFGDAPDRPCWAKGSLAAYGMQSRAEAWRTGFAGWRELTAGCPAEYRAVLTAARPAYDASASTFVAAVGRLRTVAAQRFGTISRRCVRQEIDRGSFMPAMRCTQVYDAAAGRPPPRWIRLRL